MQITIEIKRKEYDSIVQSLFDSKEIYYGEPSQMVNKKVRKIIEEIVATRFAIDLQKNQR